MCGGSQAVRQEAATLSCAGAIPARRLIYLTGIAQFPSETLFDFNTSKLSFEKRFCELLAAYDNYFQWDRWLNNEEYLA